MRCKRHCPFIIKSVVNLACLILLLAWAWFAVDKYISQPISTHVSFTKGDVNHKHKITFPFIMICPFTYPKHGFLDEVISSDVDFNVDQFMENITKKTQQLSSFVLKASLYVNGNANPEKDLQGFLHATLQMFSGPCIELNTEKFDVTVNYGGIAEVLLVLNDSIIEREYALLLFHSKYDSADAMEINPSFIIKKGKHQRYGLKKRMVSTESTRKIPCGAYDVQTCNNVVENEIIAGKFGCKVPYLNFGQYLNKYVAEYASLPICTSNIIREVFAMLYEIEEECRGICSGSKACLTTTYTVKNERISDWIESDNGTTHLVFSFSTFQVEHYNTYISYDFLSLVAELGGLMGMTLGLAFSSLGDLMANLAMKFLGRP